MKKSLLLLIIHAIILVIVPSCSDIFVEPSVNNSIIDEATRRDIIQNAINWFEENSYQTKTMDNWVPIWEDAYVELKEDYITIEIPLSFINEKLFIYDEYVPKTLIRNITKLIIEKNVNSSEFRGFLMYIVPSKEYFCVTNSVAQNNHYNKIDNIYTGKIIYSSINGEFSYAYDIDNGYVTQIKERAISNVTKSSPNFVCEDILTITYTEWTYNNSTIVEISDVQYSIETICWEVVGNDGLREHVSELPPKFPGGGNLVLIPEYKSIVADNILFRDTTGMDNIESILQQIKNDSILNKLLNYISDAKIEFIFSDTLGKGVYMTFLYDKNAQSYLIKYIESGITIDKVFHELSHAWFRKTFPDISISGDLNAELIAVFAEYIALKRYTIDGGITLYGFGPGVSQFDIPNIWNNPTLEGLIRLESFFHAQRGGVGTPYENKRMNSNTMLLQFIAFKNFFGNIQF